MLSTMNKNSDVHKTQFSSLRGLHNRAETRIMLFLRVQEGAIERRPGGGGDGPRGAHNAKISA